MARIQANDIPRFLISAIDAEFSIGEIVTVTHCHEMYEHYCMRWNEDYLATIPEHLRFEYRRHGPFHTITNRLSDRLVPTGILMQPKAFWKKGKYLFARRPGDNDGPGMFSSYDDLVSAGIPGRRRRRVKAAEKTAAANQKALDAYARHALFLAQDGYCSLCGLEGVREQFMHVDHWVPRDAGGGMTRNLTLQHEYCNRWKSDRQMKPDELRLAFAEAHLGFGIDARCAGLAMEQAFKLKWPEALMGAA